MQQKLEDLHRQASGHYLRGDFQAAVTTWQELLSLHPDDERAREGIRLCEQLAGGIDPSQTPPAATVSAPPPAMGATEQVPPDVPAPGLATPASEEPAIEEGAQLQASPPPPRQEVEPLDLSMLDGDGVAGPTAAGREPPAEPAPGVDAAAAIELRRRTEALLNEANELAKRGDLDAALRTLDRVLILDEENEQAFALQRQLQSTGQGVLPAGSVPDLAAAEPDFTSSGHDPEATGPDLDLPAPEFTVTGNDVLPPEPPPVPAETAPPSFDAEEAPVAEPPAPAPEPAPASKAEPAPPPPLKGGLPPWARDRRVQSGVAGALLVGAVFAGLQLVGGGDGAPLEPLNAVEDPDPGGTGNRGPSAAAVADEPIEVAARPAASVEDPAELMSAGEAAFAAGDYAAAVIAYDRLLKLDPTHSEARVKLKVAADRYRDQQAKRAQWNKAADSFEQGHYAEALRQFYRMRDDQYEADLDRCKVNGWYNLGVAALKANDCPRATEHFEEARAIHPEDEDVLTGLDLADLCRGPAVQADIRKLQYRLLND